jgi:hypothetical protein
MAVWACGRVLRDGAIGVDHGLQQSGFRLLDLCERCPLLQYLRQPVQRHVSRHVPGGSAAHPIADGDHRPRWCQRSNARVRV